MDADDDELVLFQQCASNAEASLLQGLLEANEIYAYIQGERHRALLGLVGTYIQLNVMVPRSELEHAKTVVQQARDAAKSLDG
jgi:hypothetical protein